MSRGKEKCKQLKSIRKTIAESYNLEYTPRECNYEGDCLGTCPLCDAEIQDLQRQLDERGITDVYLNIGLDYIQDTRLDDKTLRHAEIPDESYGNEDIPTLGIPVESYGNKDIPGVWKRKVKTSAWLIVIGAILLLSLIMSILMVFL